MTRAEHADELHHNGIHVGCKLAPKWANTSKRIGNGSSTSCPLAGKVERFHSHDHDGPLVCGCDDFDS